MKLSYLIPAILISAIAVDVSAQQRGKDKGEQTLKWRVQQLHQDNNEGVAVGDIDGNGKLDVTAGEFWYQAPDFKQRPVRELTAFGDDYLSNISELLDDVLGEFKLDHVAWHTGSGMFLCQGTVNRNYWSLRQARQAMKKAGWVEEPEARQLD